MRRLGLLSVLAMVLPLASSGCAELGVVGDGTSLSVGKPSRGYLVDGVRLPDDGVGYTTREVWRARDNRYGTDELVDLITGAASRVQAEAPGTRLVVADLAGRGGAGGSAFHRSHQSGRDVDLVYFVRDRSGQPVEADAMRPFNRWGWAMDGSGLRIDVPRTWLLVKELITGPEAIVQWVFMYEPIAWMLIEHAQKIGESPVVIARARRALKQPGDSARHDDHMHVRVYCATEDRAYGCVDIGPMELWAERAAEPSRLARVTAALAQAAAAEPAPSDGVASDEAGARVSGLGASGFGAFGASALGVSGSALDALRGPMSVMASDASPAASAASDSDTAGGLARLRWLSCPRVPHARVPLRHGP